MFEKMHNKIIQSVLMVTVMAAGLSICGAVASVQNSFAASIQDRIPVSAKLSLQSGIQPGANGRNRIPLSRTDPAYTVQQLDLFPAIYLEVTFSNGSTSGPHDYTRDYAYNIVFDDTSGDPNNLIKVVYWDVDSSNPGRGKYAAQLTSTGNGVGTAYLTVSFRNAANVKATVEVEVVSGTAQSKPITTTNNVEEQFWDAVKNSQRAGDLQEYLKNYPNGKYSATARQKLNLYSGQSSSPVNRPSPVRQTDVEYLNKWAAEVGVGLPETMGDFQLTEAMSQCPAGCQEKLDPGDGNELALVFKTNRYDTRSDFNRQVIPALKPLLLPEYCKSEGMTRNIRLVVFVLDNSGRQLNNFFVFPKDCSANSYGGLSGRSAANYLISEYAAGDVRLGMTIAEARRALNGATLARQTADANFYPGEDDQFTLSSGGRVMVTLTPKTYDENGNAIPVNENSRIRIIRIFDSRYRAANGIYPGMAIADAERIFGRLFGITMLYGSSETGRFSGQPAWLTFGFRGTSGRSAGIYDGKYGDPREKITTKLTPGAYIYSVAIASK